MPLEPIDQELARQLQRFLSVKRFSSVSALTKAIAQTVPGTASLDRAVVKRFLAWAIAPPGTPHPSCQSQSQATIRKFVEAKFDEVALQEHRDSWTSRILPVNDSDPPQQALHLQGLNASLFKQRLIEAIGKGGLPERVEFVNHTGQWLKPVLRALLRHPISIRAFVCDPASTASGPGAAPDPYLALGVLEFFWSLPTSLRLDREHELNPNARLELWTYDGSSSVANRMALFEGVLVASSPTTYLNHLPCMHGHPACEGRVRCIQGPATADVWVRGHADFRRCEKHVVDQIAKLPRNQPRVTWTIRGFEFLDNYAQEIDPARIFAKPGFTPPSPSP